VTDTRRSRLRRSRNLSVRSADTYLALPVFSRRHLSEQHPRTKNKSSGRDLCNGIKCQVRRLADLVEPMQPLCCFISSRAREWRAYSPFSTIELFIWRRCFLLPATHDQREFCIVRCGIYRGRENRHVPYLFAACARNAQKFKGRSRIDVSASLRGLENRGTEDAESVISSARINFLPALFLLIF